MLLYDPYYIYQIGFQLSFAVTFGLIVAYPTLERRIILSSQRFLAGDWNCSFSRIASLAHHLVHFYQFSPLSLLLNMLICAYLFPYLYSRSLSLTLLSFVHVDLDYVICSSL